jgi:hypothetical protein
VVRSPQLHEGVFHGIVVHVIDRARDPFDGAGGEREIVIEANEVVVLVERDVVG